MAKKKKPTKKKAVKPVRKKAVKPAKKKKAVKPTKRKTVKPARRKTKQRPSQFDDKFRMRGTSDEVLIASFGARSDG